jgi:N-carbamoylputrescine amidase
MQKIILFNIGHKHLGERMRRVRIGLIQARWEGEVTNDKTIKKNMENMIRKHETLTETASMKGVNILCFQELFYGPYFCAEQDIRWYKYAEPIPGPLSNRMCELAKKHDIILIVSIYEKEIEGILYNTAILIDQDGNIIGKYRKTHLPQLYPGFWEKFYFKPGNLGYPVFDTKFAKIGVYICYDRHFPEGARILGLNGAEIVFNPSATVKGLSEYLWTLEQPAHAVANGYYIAAINRVGDCPWGIGRFFGSSYVANPRGEIIKQASQENEELLVVDIDLDMIKEIRSTWQFFRDRRPELYNRLTTN